MVSRFVDTQARHRIYLKDFDGSEDWFEIAAQISRRDRIRLEESLVAVSRKAGSDDLAIAPTNSRHYAMLMKFAIKDWSFEDDTGRVLPVTDATIAQLEDSLGEWMAVQIDTHYASRRRTDDERKNSASEPSVGTWETDNSLVSWPISS